MSDFIDVVLYTTIAFIVAGVFNSVMHEREGLWKKTRAPEKTLSLCFGMLWIITVPALVFILLINFLINKFTQISSFLISKAVKMKTKKVRP
jgi:hypothetical protein